VSGKRSAEIRMELARGHAALGEPLEALAALARAAREEPGVPGLLALVEELIEDGSNSPEQRVCRAGLQVLREQLLASFEALAAGPTAPPPAASLAAPLPRPEPARAPSSAAELEAALELAETLEPEAATLEPEADPESAEPLAAALAEPDAEAEPYEPEPLEVEALAEEPTPADLAAHSVFRAGRGELLPEIALDEALEDEALADEALDAEALDAEAFDGGGMEDDALLAAEAEESPATPLDAASAVRLQVLERWLANAREQRSRA
jgi:hypothetical protein